MILILLSHWVVDNGIAVIIGVLSPVGYTGLRQLDVRASVVSAYPTVIPKPSCFVTFLAVRDG